MAGSENRRHAPRVDEAQGREERARGRNRSRRRSTDRGGDRKRNRGPSKDKERHKCRRQDAHKGGVSLQQIEEPRTELIREGRPRGQSTKAGYDAVTKPRGRSKSMESPCDQGGATAHVRPELCTETATGEIAGSGDGCGVSRPAELGSVRMTKSEINQLPLRKHSQDFLLVQNHAQAVAALQQLRTETLLGFDTETKPVFKKGKRNLPSLIQLAGEHKTFIFQLSKIGFPSELQRLLADPSVTKAGVAVADDIKGLQEIAFFHPAGFAELAEMAKKAGLDNFGLRGLAAVLLGFRMSKQLASSNWGLANLTDAQLNYAALDASASRDIYLKLVSRQQKAPP